MNKLLFFIIGAIVLLSSCGNRKEISATKIPHKGKGFLLQKLENSTERNYKTLTWKAEVDLDQNGKKNSFKVNARLKKDSIIWMSITPALGIEVARVCLTVDSVKLVNKLDKKYFLGTYDYLSSKFGVDINYNLIQNALTGCAILFDSDDKFKAFTEQTLYMLQTKGSKKLARLTKTKKDDWAPLDSIEVRNARERRIQKALEKLPDEATLLTRYWLEPESFNLVKQGVYDFEQGKQVEVEFEAPYKTFETLELPTKIHISASGDGKYFNVNIELNKIRLDRDFSIPFKIPEKYVPMD